MQILTLLGQLQFATNLQLARMCAVDPRRISDATTKLLNAGLIDGSLLTRPMILGLTPAGGRLLDTPLPSGRRHSSWAVMAHACHRNEAGEILAKEHKGFRFLSRLELLKRGFNPGVGEHGALDDSGKAWFVLVDDYMMGSDRISRAWTRRHTPSQKYWRNPTGRTWCDTAQRFLVVCTDAKHAERHRAWILKANLKAELPADVMLIKPLWKS